MAPRIQCKICKGDHLEMNCPVMKQISSFLPKVKENLSGSSPPEIFVGRFNYPNIYAGVLSPQIYGETEQFAMPELWHKQNLNIQQILNLRSQLIYGRFRTNIKTLNEKKFLPIMQEIALASKPTATEFQFAKPVKTQIQSTSFYPIISNQAPLKKIVLEENPHTEKRVEYIINDDELKSIEGVKDLYKHKIPISNIVKILSAGLLGLKKNRKLVPTRWSITAVDDTISKTMIARIKSYQEISDFRVFHAEYVGNYYEFILFPSSFSFEVIEIRLNPDNTYDGIWQDSETIFKRKKYAESVTGAYYANRLALTEYLEKIQRQAAFLALRQVTPDYWAPLGVGILREASRSAFTQRPETFSTLQEALNSAQTRLRIPVQTYTEKSNLIKNFKTQRTLRDFF